MTEKEVITDKISQIINSFAILQNIYAQNLF
jgi:hypothetical protein